MKQIVGILATLFGLGLLLLVVVVIPWILPLVLLLALLYGWMLHAFLQYSQGRQEELLHLLTTAAEAQVPLAPALRAYVQDRPQGALREFWVALLLFFVLPGYYWFWHRRHSFDRKVRRVAARLERGDTLPEALDGVPGVVSGQTLLAVTVGQATGRLALCLRNSARDRLAAAALEVLPRLLYPVILLFFLSLVLGFWTVYILPRMQMIFRELGSDLPETTIQVATIGEVVLGNAALVTFVFLLVTFLALVLVGPATTFWYLPGVRRFYRMNVQGRVLKMLSVLLEAGKPAPEALGLLADPSTIPLPTPKVPSGLPAATSQGITPVNTHIQPVPLPPVALPPVNESTRRTSWALRLLSGESKPLSAPAHSRLEATRDLVAQGESLAEALHQSDLLPAAMVPLVQASERTQRLPWALDELGEELSNRATRLLRRTTLVLFPLFILLVGVVIGFMVVGMFLPLVDVIWRLST